MAIPVLIPQSTSIDAWHLPSSNPQLQQRHPTHLNNPICGVGEMEMSVSEGVGLSKLFQLGATASRWNVYT